MAFKVFFLTILVVVYSYELQQVLILSRHNIRTPVLGNFDRYSPYSWPKWNKTGGFLTEKGALMEEYMGEHIYNSIIAELFGDRCPEERFLHIFANTEERTRETAKAFVRGAFKNCNIDVVSRESDEMDPIFNPIIRNDSELVKDPIVKEMQDKLRKLDLRKSYSLLEEILDMKNSNACKMDGVCQFDSTNNEILYVVGEVPGVVGPLLWTYLMVDSFLMGYYDGHAIDDVAWGKIQDDEQWKTLTQITREYRNIVFNSTLLGRQISKPLLGYILSVVNNQKPTKFTLLNGHDANLYSVLAALDVKGFSLPGQYELVPIGGKIVFQKWYDNVQNRNLFKMDFVYLTVEQLRTGSKLPPKWVQLSMNDCPTDSNGFCSWEYFINVLNYITEV